MELLIATLIMLAIAATGFFLSEHYRKVAGDCTDHRKYRKYHARSEFCGVFFCCIPGLLCVLLTGGLVVGNLMAFLSHAGDLGTLRAQSNVIAVYQNRIDRLDERLEVFNYPEADQAVLLNADSPVASIVESLTEAEAEAEAEAELARAEAKRAQAIVDIESRAAGPVNLPVVLHGKE